MTESVYDSLLAVASTNPAFISAQPNEPDQTYLSRLVAALSGVDEIQWAKLPEDAQKWYDSCIDENDALKTELPSPGGFPPPQAAQPAVRRRVATPVVTVFEQLLNEVRTVVADFADKHTKESDNDYLSRLLRDLPQDISSGIADWVTAADEAQTQSHPLPLPAGYTAQDKPKKATAATKAPKTSKAEKAPETAAEPAEPVADACAIPARSATNGTGNGHDHQFVDADGKPLTGIKLFNARLAAGLVSRRKRAKSDKPVDKTPRDSVTNRIRDAVTANPKVTVEQLQKMISDAGLKETTLPTITTTKASHLSAMRSLERCGWKPPHAE